MLKKICHDYDQKHRLLMIENDQLRQCLIEINRQLERLLLIHRLPTESLPDILNGDTESFETRSSYSLGISLPLSFLSSRIDPFTM